MATRWDTFPVQLTGGLVSSMSRLQHGLQQPGSARVLENFEPSTKGGYRRINGFTKFEDTIVPPYGEVVVQGSGQTGTTLFVADTHETPVIGDTLTVSGVTGTYLVSSVSFVEANKSSTLTLTTSLASSPDDKASITFVTGQSRIEGVWYSSAEAKSYALRGGALWSSSGSGWSKVNTPVYGTTLVATGSQTGTTLDIDGIAVDTYVPQAGDTFNIAGVEKLYTVLTNTTSSSGAATLSIDPALSSSPDDNAVVTFVSSSHTDATKVRFKEFNFNGVFKTVVVDSKNNPAVFHGTSYKTLQGSVDVTGANFAETYQDHLFFGKGDLVSFTAPFDEEDFTSANGAGNFRVPSNLTGVITFREQLVVFSQTDIRKLSGTSLANFSLSAITSDVGCVSGDTVQEVGGDILFLGPDGVRFLGATERLGDFNLSLASRQIQDDFKGFIVTGTEYCTSVVREKNQYRVFSFSPTTNKQNTVGYIGTQFQDQNAQSISWGQTKGIKAYRSCSSYQNDEEILLFTNDDEYVYRLESGNDFDGVAITSAYHTPFMAVTDPTMRKTAYKVDTYFDPEGLVTGTLTPRYDFNKPGKIQPNAVPLTGGGAFSFYGTARYGTSLYGGNPDTFLERQVVGSFFTISLQYVFDGGPPFVLDTAIIEYSTEDKK